MSGESDVLYAALDQLTRANTLQEIFEAVSSYPRGCNASAARLLVAQRDGEPLALDEVASWAQASDAGLPDDPAWLNALISRDEPIFVDDGQPGTGLRLQDSGLHSVAVLPLINHQRRIGLLLFGWHTDYRFTETDRRILRALQQHTAPVIDAIRLLADSRQRTSRAELLLNIGSALARASDEASILDALTPLLVAQSVRRSALAYIDLAEALQPEATFEQVMGAFSDDTVAVWSEGNSTASREAFAALVQNASVYGLRDLWLKNSSECLFIPNFATEYRLPDAQREALLANVVARAVVLIPLFSAGRYQGYITISWTNPHEFSDDERELYAVIRQMITPIVATRRAYLAEQAARQESEVLYRVGKAINAAHSFEGVIDALTEIPLPGIGVSLGLYENFNQRGAAHMDTVARPFGQKEYAYDRFTVDEYPLLQAATDIKGVLDFGDMLAHPLVDDRSRELLRKYNTRAMLAVPLWVGERWIGTLSFPDVVPHQYTMRERRLAAGLGDLVANAVERIRLSQAAQAARERAETLAHIQAALTRARRGEDIQSAIGQRGEDILSAIGQYADTIGAQQVTLNTDTDVFASDAQFAPRMWQRENGRVTESRNGETSAPRLSTPGIIEMWQAGPDRVQFIEDTSTEVRIRPQQRAHFTSTYRWRACVFIPLRYSGEYQGFVGINWAEPHRFTDSERYILEQLQQPLSSIVAARRAFLAEQEASHESQLLYLASQAINAAMTIEQILTALVSLRLPGMGVGISVFEHYDERAADHFDLTARALADDTFYYTRISMDELPIVRELPRYGMVAIEDTRTDPIIDDQSRLYYERVGLRSLIGCGLFIGARFVGAVSFYGMQPRHFTAQEKRLAAGIADMVANAIERIRLRKETDSARERAETLARLQAALTRTKTEEEILTTLAEHAIIDGAQRVWLNHAVVNPEFGPFASEPVGHWENGQITYWDPANPMPRLSQFGVAELWQAEPERVLFIENVATEPRLSEAQRAGLIQHMCVRAVVVIPLYSSGEFQGLIGFNWAQPRTLTDSQQYIYTQLQQPLAAIVGTRRAFLAEQQRAHQLESIAKFSAAATGILKQDELLRTVVELAHTSFSHLHFEIFLLDEFGRHLYQATRPSARFDPIAVPVESATSLIAEAARLRSGVMVGDITNVPNYELASLMPGGRSELAVPMVAGNKLIGVLDVQSSKVAGFSEADMWVMSTLADLIAVAIQNAQLYGQAQEVAAYEERNRLARELHDSVSQALYGIALGARTARALLDRDPARLKDPLDYILSLADAGLMEMRALIFDLRVDSLQEEGLIAALTKQTASLSARHKIAVYTEFCPEPTLSLDAKEGLYWIAREALHNIVKHAQATRIDVKVQCDYDGLQMDITDNGLGFDPSGEFRGHLGLNNMRERASKLNGMLDLITAPGIGTTIHVHIPDGRL